MKILHKMGNAVLGRRQLLLRRAKGVFVPLMLSLGLSGCSSLAYYSQLAEGQWQLLRAREPLAEVIADRSREPQLRARLAYAQKAREFASQALGLPDNRSYRLYADIGRPVVVWNVFATPAFSLQPVTHCFPVAGCVAYRGYYQQSGARGEAALQKLQGHDTYIGGVDAYSTLGWFDDPLLSSMLGWDDDRLASLIFHELAHQRLYVEDDTAFNESYATFVEQQGNRQWRAARGLPEQDPRLALQRQQFTQLVLDTRERLAALYAQPLPAPQMADAKAAEFEGLRRRYQQWRDSQWPGDLRYDARINSPMNNAKLLPFGLYDQWAPAFACVFKQAAGDWPEFYQAVERIARLDPPARQALLLDRLQGRDCG